LYCFLTAAEAQAQTEVVYTLTAVFVGADEGDDENPPVMTIQLFEDGSRVVLRIAENARFIAPRAVTGLPADNITFTQFAERLAYQTVEIGFVVREDEFFVIECRLVTAR